MSADTVAGGCLPPGNLCPECNGNGWDGGAEVAPRAWDEPPDAEYLYCYACWGTGTLDTLLDEEEA